ncbi:redox-regulated ATPase YchF [Candidatus Collierbacteria bacterium]|nr:redox-regulated ATPase YchF [Candidatus Collierbacteria bacterium]
MSLKVGIVGLPNVGKSTLFNALLKRQQALVANYPFATIEPNVGVVEVPDERLKVLAGIVNTEKLVFAMVEFVDIAGLVKGASEGAGLGNQFLTHIREVDVIVHLIRGFADPNVVKEGSVDPKADYEVIKAELALKDLETVKKQLESKEIRLPENLKQKVALEKLFSQLDKGGASEEIKHLNLLSLKPEIVVFNVSESDLSITPLIPPLNLRGGHGEIPLCISAKVEAEIASLSEEDTKLYLEELGIRESGLDSLIKAAYERLGLLSFLTAGEKEVRAWTIKRGTKAPQAAGVIHTDFEKRYIKTRAVNYEDFVSFRGWKGAAEAGKMRIEGREYVIREGDVVEFLIGT